MVVINPFAEATEAILETGGGSLKACYQCGLCTSTCPWNLVREFSSRKIIHESQVGLLVEIGKEENWLCTTCGACVARCPRGVEIIDIFKAIRAVGIQYGVVPKNLHLVLAGIRSEGNPWNDTRENRTKWAKKLKLEPSNDQVELLYFPCCTPIYDHKSRRIAVATVELFRKANIPFGILGTAENCCGESVRKIGDNDLFETLKELNLLAFRRQGVKKIVVSSPHCYHTFKNEYGLEQENIQVVHITQFIYELFEKGKLAPKKSLEKRAIYHDPCYLGRHNGIYEVPRQLLSKIPGLDLVEFTDSKAESICCGGGGGRIWMETKKEERLSCLRIDQALDMKADILAIACPYCMLNFDDSLLVEGKEGMLEIRDVVELVNSVT